MKKNSKTFEDILKAKRRRRRSLAELSIEEKVRILVRLQRIAAVILSARGLKRRPWEL